VKAEVPKSTTGAIKETIMTGTVGMDVFLKYFRSGANIVGLVCLFLVLLLAQTNIIVADW
jgi:hypothetical protein